MIKYLHKETYREKYMVIKIPLQNVVHTISVTIVFSVKLTCDSMFTCHVMESIVVRKVKREKCKQCFWLKNKQTKKLN